MPALGVGIGPEFARIFGTTSLVLSARAVDENVASGTAIGTLSVLNGSGTYTFTITADPDSKFAINVDGETLETAAALDYETATSHLVTIEADNGVDTPISRQITITVNNVFEAASLSALTLDNAVIVTDSTEDTVVGAIVGKTTGSTVSLVDDAGGRFKLSGSNIVAGATATDYDVATSHNITIRETLADSANSPRDSVIAITVALLADAGMGETFAFIGSPAWVRTSWAAAGNPVVQVEKGWGSGTFQDLYPTTSGVLYTEPDGAGSTATAFAAGEKLFVHRIYNQAGTDPSSDYVSALADDKRVLLDVSTPAAPCFAGYSTGTQDANQHATERGYDLGSIFTLKTNDHLLNVIAAMEMVNSEDCYFLQDDVTPGSAYYRVREGVGDHFALHAIAVGIYPLLSAPLPMVVQQVAFDDARGLATDYTQRGGTNGVFFEGTTYASAATSRTFNLFGPTNSLQGKCYAILVSENEIPEASLRFDGIPSRLARIFAADIETDRPSIAFPYANAVVPMNLGTETADIPIKLFGKPSTEYEAQWQSGGYSSIGTTDIYGVLDSALAAQAKGNGTLDVREVGGSTPMSIANVAVGIVVYAMGESGADGRGTDVTHTIPTGSLRKDRANWTAASKEWWKLLLQELYDEFGCVIGVTKEASGSTYFRNGATSGHWSINNTSVAYPNFARGLSRIVGMQAEFLTPNFFIWDIGKNDASLLTPEATFESEFTALLNYYRTQTSNINLKFWCILSGDNTGVAATYTDAIRKAQKDLWDTDGFEALGSFAHLEGDLDGVHFDSQAQKQKAADIAYRHLRGAGRAPQYSSATVSGSDLEITFTGGVSPLTLSGTLSTDDNGWSISDGNGARTITAMAVSGLVLTITLDQALSGTVTFSFGSGDTSQGGTLLDSDATTPLPPEPFSASAT